jgi:hypothetical protein
MELQIYERTKSANISKTCFDSWAMPASQLKSATLTAAAFLVPVYMLAGHTVRAETAHTFPPRLENYLSTVVQPTKAERDSLLTGNPLIKLLDADSNSEVVVFGGIWINATMHRYVEKLNDIENFETGNAVRITKRIGSVPTLKDFAAMSLPAKDIEDLRHCRLEDCKLKVSAEALRRFQTRVDWSAPNHEAAVNAIARQLALEYVEGYLEGGDERLAAYRDSSRPTYVAQEFRLMVDQMPELTTFIPDLRRYLLGFPKVELPGATSFLYWQDAQFGLKPTIRISHLTIRERPEDTIVASKMLYANHYFWTALELRLLVPDASRGEGFWFFSLSRSRSDGLSGFRGSVIRGRVHRGVRDSARGLLIATKAKLEH